METLQLIDEKLRVPQDLCLNVAKRVFKERSSTDTNPQIVQMVSGGQPIDHWYYRSDQWIEQPYYDPSDFVQPYVGPVSEANLMLYGPGTYIPDEEMVELIRKGII